MKVVIYTKHRLDILIKAIKFAMEHCQITDEAFDKLQMAFALLSSISDPEKVRMDKKGYSIKRVLFYIDKTDDNIIDLATSGLTYRIIKEER